MTAFHWQTVLGLTSVFCAATAQAQTQTPTPSLSSAQPQFTVPEAAGEAPAVLPNIKDPQAVDAQSVCPGYIAKDVHKSGSGLTASLALAGPACNVYGTDITALNLTVEYQTADRLHVEIVPTYLGKSNMTQYILPASIVSKPTQQANGSSDLDFSWTNNPSFAFNVTRKSTGDVLFSTEGKKLVFENQFIEFSSVLPENYNLYGLGETINSLRVPNNFTKTFYAADALDAVDLNLYGSHPFYLETRYFEQSADGKLSLVTNNETETSPTGKYTSYSHGVYFRNAHGQDVLMRPNNITWRSIGGSIDLYFFSGPSQPEVTTQYLNVVGLPVMQQFWTLGFHQCRWGYKNWTQMQEVVDNHAKFGIPLETIWNDIDYMNRYRDFELDPVNFNLADATAFLKRLHDSGRHYVPIIDSAIYIPNPSNPDDAYAVFERGNATGSFLKNPDGSLYIGDVWPGYTVFPDWVAPGTEQWWIEEFVEFHKQFSFDGAWIDMSEISSFCTGSCGSKNLTLQPVHPPFALPGEPKAQVVMYPEGFSITNTTEAASASAVISSSMSAYPTASTSTSYLRTTPTPGVRDVNYPPYTINNIQGALGRNAISPNATHADGTLEYELHNVWGHSILKATYKALSAVFPKARPFIIGRSTFAGSGAVAGHWGGDNFSLWSYMFYSIPQALQMQLLGIPMFGVDTCGFAGNTDMELCSRWMQLSAFFPFYRNHNILAAIPQEAYNWAGVIDASKTAMAVRYQLLNYMYTLFYRAHEQGHTVMRALAWEFPNDPTLAAADRQFMLGSSILVTPVLEPNVSTVKGVFPGLIEGTEKWYDWFNNTAVPVPSEKNTTITAPLGHIPVVAPTETLMINFAVSNSTLKAAIKQGGWVDQNTLRNVTIWGVEKHADVKFNGKKISPRNVQFDKKKSTLIVSGLNATAWTGSSWILEW
ncbi:hypothetical protein AWENTII_001528 [Aspergillus wentii]|nr:hypothetical protein MW887_010399 [Aspergillus wentii]